MPTVWTPDSNVDPSTSWTSEAQADVTWATESAVESADDNTSWSTALTDAQLRTDARGWRLEARSITQAGTKRSAVFAGNFTVIDLKVLPTDISILPQDMQDDHDDWTILAEPS